MARLLKDSKDVSVDRLSKLPEEIICQILSFLPTREAVKTSLLSPKFLNLWKNISTLRFSHHAVEGEHNQSVDEPLTRFVNFVYMVFSLLKTTHIDKLSIELPGFVKRSKPWIIRACLRNWIVVALAKNVKSFELLNLPSSCSRFELPDCIFTCNSLEILKLRNIYVNLKGTTSVRLPNLRILRLEDNCDIENECIAKIVSGCSLLHTLYVSREDQGPWLFNFGLSICSPTLQYLTIMSSTDSYDTDDSDSDSDTDSDTDSDSDDSDNDDNDKQMRIMIDAPALKYLHLKEKFLKSLSIETSSLLKYLHIKQTKLKYFSIKTSSRLIVAEISLGTIFYDLIQSLSNVKILHLTVSDAWLESAAHSHLLPTFPNLTNLTVCNFFGEFDFLKELLHKSPTLVTLGLKCIDSGHNNDFSKDNLISRFRFPTLKLVTVDNFDGSIGQLKVLKYILLNASSLKKITIMPQADCERKHELLQKISMFRRRSKHCRIKFH